MAKTLGFITVLTVVSVTSDVIGVFSGSRADESRFDLWRVLIMVGVFALACLGYSIAFSTRLPLGGPHGVRRRKRAAGVAVLLAGAGILVVQTEVVDFRNGHGGAVQVAVEPGNLELPRVTAVRCTDAGTDVQPARVAASADGVHIVVADDTSDTSTYLTFEGGEEPVPTSSAEQVRPLAPGKHNIGCVHSPGMEADDAETLTVVDPYGFYEDVSAASVLGCALTAAADGPIAEGATGLQAAAAWVTAHAPGGTLTPAAGYRGDPQRSYLLNSPTERATLQVSAIGDGHFTAGPASVC